MHADGNIHSGVVAIGSRYAAKGDINLQWVESTREKPTRIQAGGTLTLSEQRKLSDGTELSASTISIPKLEEMGKGVRITARELILGEQTYDLTRGGNSVQSANEAIRKRYGDGITVGALAPNGKETARSNRYGMTHPPRFQDAIGGDEIYGDERRVVTGRAYPTR